LQQELEEARAVAREVLALNPKFTIGGFGLSFGVGSERRSARQRVELSEKGGANSESDSHADPTQGIF
jgi:hypothetical protein